MEEIWKPWPKDNKYLVSNKGRLKGKSGKILTPTIDINRGGYYFYNIDKPNTTNQRTKISMHRILMETFNPIENMDKLVVDHINGIRTDNRLENLRWVTKKENDNYKIQNREKINNHINFLISLYGYREVEKKILELK